jgi:hypothetical protein
LIQLYYFQRKDDFYTGAWATDREGTVLPDRPSWKLRFTQPANPAIAGPALQRIIEGLKRDGYLVENLRAPCAAVYGES